MAEKLLMLALSPTMEAGTIVKWNKKVGDSFSTGDTLCEVETDKTTMEYESTLDGTLLKIVATEGSQVQVGEPIGIAGEPGEDISDFEKELAASQTPAQTTASTPSTPGPQAPVAPAPSPVQSQSQSQTQAQDSAPPSAAPGEIIASPLARKMASEMGIDLRTISGSGPNGRIVKRDIESAGGSAPRTETSAEFAQPQLPAQDQTIPVSEKRKIIAQRLADSFYSAPHYFLKSAVNMDNVLSARKRINKQTDDRYSLNAFIIKFAAEALKRHPMANASWQGDSITIHGSIDIALAVAQPDGLITPVVRNCGNKGFGAIDRELKQLIKKAQENKLSPQEYSNCTFTISNLGSFGIREFTAIINPPASAILAVGEISRQPVADENDAVAIQNTMMMTLSCDHRILDGAVGAAFLKDLKSLLEDPVKALV
ncbi:MAG: pyruvate dehydrogenase complex dihydrolipoamide acetyltransferase [Chitinivibrionales bacterium]|nr:pyruvate dehydrogenase complex dihydrolipoamide acetyltransferase [Chitinivibrionales bacterium]